MDDLKLIKKHYGEKMMHLCRELFPTILEESGTLFNIMKDTFAFEKDLYDDLYYEDLIEEFKNLIYSNYVNTTTRIRKKANKSVKELLSEAGYDLYECKSEEDIQSFKKYYEKNEQLCTFRGGRLESCYVFFAVKKNVDEIKRSDFNDPKRQDEYGTSVISIQFSKKSNYISIKNRYNHTVSNPDATFSNNLDNIIEGLTDAFEDEYGLDIKNSCDDILDISDYIYASDGRYYKVNLEEDYICYCRNNIIIDNNDVCNHYIEKERYLFADSYIIDLKEKRVFEYVTSIDGFTNSLGNIKEIKVTKDSKDKSKTVYFYNDLGEEIVIKIDKNNNIIYYKNEYIQNIDSNFLRTNRRLEKIDIQNVINIKDNFLFFNMALKEINLPKVVKIGDGFLSYNRYLNKASIENIEFIGHDFLVCNDSITSIYFPKLKYVGSSFLHDSGKLREVNLDNLEEASHGFLVNSSIHELYLPKLKKVENRFLKYNMNIKYFFAPHLECVGDDFMHDCFQIESINFPYLKKVGSSFLRRNYKLSSVYLPSLELVHDHFLEDNEFLTELDLGNLISVGDGFLVSNNQLRSVNLSSLTKVGNYFLSNNNKLKILNLPKVETIGSYFLASNSIIKELYFPNVVSIGKSFMNECKLYKIDLPSLKVVDSWFLSSNNTIREAYFPDLTDISHGFIDVNDVMESIYAPNITDKSLSIISNPHIKQLIESKQMRLRRK